MLINIYKQIVEISLGNILIYQTLFNQIRCFCKKYIIRRKNSQKLNKNNKAKKSKMKIVNYNLINLPEVKTVNLKIIKTGKIV